MSAEPPSSSGLPGRSRPVLSDLSKETTEGDLWNLDDEAPTISRRMPAPAPAGPMPGGEADESSEATAPVPLDPSVAEPSAPLTPRGVRNVPADEIGDLDEPRDETKEEVVTMVVPRELAPLGPAPSPAAAETIAPTKKGVLEPESEPAGEASFPKENKPPGTAPVPDRPASRRHLMNRREALGLAAFAFVFLVAAIWVLTRFFGQIPMKSEFVEAPDFPIEGSHAKLATAETFWRSPVRDGPSRDVARREVVMIPVVEIELDPEKSPAGALRVVFRNSLGEPVGDSITRSFSVGRYDSSGNAKAMFPATDGFLDEGSFSAYRTGKGDPWMAEVLEAPSIDAPAGSFKRLTLIPVLPLRR